jgi:myo-inositol-1(or 4)-monophosphatase
MSKALELPKAQIRALVSFAEHTARGAGAILKLGFNKNYKIRYKGRIDPVTEFDLKSEKFIIAAIQKRFPDHGILSEEGNDREAIEPFLWIIDPLDGTVDFAHGFPVYCVSIGVEYRGRSIVGAVYDPERDECFTAGIGLGARLNGKKIRVTTEKKLERALLATGFSYSIATAKRNNLGLFARMAKEAQGIRRLGSAALDLCWLASGRLDGFWELHLHPWDTAAGKLIVEEAGGKVTQFDGRPHSIFDNEILASNGHLHSGMKNVLCRRESRTIQR